MYKVIQTKILNKCFRDLKTHGKKGRDAITKARAALSEAASEGKIESLQRTNHGESRISNAEKFNLGDGYRLVVQLVDGHAKVRAFLYAGTHDDTEHWLEQHKDYVWVKSDKDKTLEFVQVSEKDPVKTKVVELDLDSPEALRDLPLLRSLSGEEWTQLSIGDDLRKYVMAVTAESWECDPSGVLDYIEEKGSTDVAIMFDDLFSHAHKGELSELAFRIKLAIGEASISSGADLVLDMQDPRNSEVFVTWEDVDTFPEDSSWADWLLFLHPAQNEIAKKNFRGPARLRGVSGSGKTCVMLHRARYLARKYKLPILLLTLTESMRKLLDSLVKELCGVESALISVLTINGLAHNVINRLHPAGEQSYVLLSEEKRKKLSNDMLEFVRRHEMFSQTKLTGLDSADLRKFIEDEVYYIRSRLRPSEFDRYVDAKNFKRHGRKIALSSEGRRVFLDAANERIEKLMGVKSLDYEGVTSTAASLLATDFISLDKVGWDTLSPADLFRRFPSYMPYRCVLVDEVQDLSQLEVSMIASHSWGGEKLSDIEDGLFLVGDGAQTIYNKGFVLKSCGVNVSNRSYVLKKNYRNTREIMLAAYSLIEKYEFADVDEDNISTPTRPDLASRCGEKPFLVKCKSFGGEVEFVAGVVQSLIEAHQGAEEDSSYPEICIIGLTQAAREEINSKLSGQGIICSELKQSGGVDTNNSVAISTIESAKGHEFKHVFIIGVVEGAMPNKFAMENGIAREASRLYVAITRGRDNIYISYNTEKDNQPSRFLVDIQDHCNDYLWASGELEANIYV